MPVIPKIPPRVTRLIIPAIRSLFPTRLKPHYNGKQSTGAYVGSRRQILQHQQPLEHPEINTAPPAQDIEYIGAALRAAERESIYESLVAGGNVHINEDGSKVYIYKQSDGKEVLVTVAVAGEGAAGFGTATVAGVAEDEYMTRDGLVTLVSAEAVLLLLLSLIVVWLWCRRRREKKRLQQSTSDDNPDEIPRDDPQFADDVEASPNAN
ncbi:hypothetical protein TWF718_007611 [Orbilia javanica]|uniref:Uncharacterized protein n=1 Tax=Orbilia javanica TaxID=47235 RepID=A0AAN8RE11_9PEZI